MKKTSWRFTDREIAHLAVALETLTVENLKNCCIDNKIMGFEPLSHEELESLYKRLRNSVLHNIENKND